MTVSDDLKPAHVISEDARLGIIRVTVAGFFDREALVSHFDDQLAVVIRWRALKKPVRMLIDAVDLKPHSPENQVYVEQAAARIYKPGDRIATLVSSSLVKMQMRRAMAPGKIANFYVSKTAAIAWLTGI